MIRTALLAGALAAGCMPVVAGGPPPGSAGAAVTTVADAAASGPNAAGADRETVIGADGARLPMRSWTPDGRPRAVLVALHGFNDYSNFIADAAKGFAAAGVAVYAYDQRGFGEAPNRGLWGGDEAMAKDALAAIAQARARHPGVPVYLFGESMGGAVAMTAMARPDAPAVAGVILSAPAVWGRASMPWYQTTALWVAAHTFPYGRMTGAGLGIRASDNVEMLKALGRDPLVIKQTRVDAVYGVVSLMDQAMRAAPRLDRPMLILYGERDEIIPEGAIRELLERLPTASREERRFALYPAGWHMLLRDHQGRVVFDDILAWIGDKAAPLPSAADVYAAEIGGCAVGVACPLSSNRSGAAAPL